MRLIDADALRTHINNVPMHGDEKVFYDIMSELVSVVAAAPTIEAVEVVRCRDCIYAKPVPAHAAKDFTDKALSCEAQRGDWKRAYGFSVVAAWGYCNEGERKEPDHE